MVGTERLLTTACPNRTVVCVGQFLIHTDQRLGRSKLKGVQLGRINKLLGVSIRPLPQTTPKVMIRLPEIQLKNAGSSTQ